MCVYIDEQRFMAKNQMSYYVLCIVPHAAKFGSNGNSLFDHGPSFSEIVKLAETPKT